MKKTYLLVLSLLILPVIAFADTMPKILTLEANNEGHTITYSGTTEDGAHAVMCKLYDSEDTELTMLSSSVDNNSFADSFTITENGEYTVACANYEGGAIKTAEVTINEEIVTHTVTFDTRGGSTITAAIVDDGQKVTEPAAPEKGGHNFEGWYEDETCTTPFDFNTPITGDITIYAKWSQIPEEPQVETHRVTFNTNSDDVIEPVNIDHEGRVEMPRQPNKDGYEFVGWYEDETCTTPFDFNTPITGDLELYAKWNEIPEENDENQKTYEVTDEDGNKISFKDEEGHEFGFAVINLANLTDEELQELTDGEINKEQYDAALDVLKEAVSDNGTFVAIYEIIVVDENDHEKEMGPFTIKLFIQDDMKGFDSYKLLYVDTDNDFEVLEEITLTKQGNFLVGTLQHLSSYVLVGNNAPAQGNSSNPQTHDNMYMWLGILIISIIGISVASVITLKSKKD